MMSRRIAAKVGPALFFWRLLCLHHHCGARPSHLNGLADDQNMINNTGTIIFITSGKCRQKCQVLGYVGCDRCDPNVTTYLLPDPYYKTEQLNQTHPESSLSVKAHSAAADMSHT